MTLGEKIASARKEKGMTQEMLAEQLGGIFFFKKKNIFSLLKKQRK